MSKPKIRTTSLIARHVSRQFSAHIGCKMSATALGASHVSGLYLEQIVCRSTDNTRMSTFARLDCTPYSGQGGCL